MNVGRVLGLSSSQHLILRAIEWNPEGHLPEIGDNVYTPEKQRIGIIADIFGPMIKPFISISVVKSPALTAERITALKGTSLFTLPSKSGLSSSKTSKKPQKRDKSPTSSKRTPPKTKKQFRE